MITIRHKETEDILWEGLSLVSAGLSGADLSQADLRGANLRWAKLIGANLEEVKGLKNVHNLVN